jgi:hypothetical protein
VPALPVGEPSVQIFEGSLPHARDHLNAGVLKHADAPPGDTRVRVQHPDNDPRHTGLDERQRTWRRASVMRTGLQGDVTRRAFGQFTSLVEGVDFRVRHSGPGRDAASHKHRNAVGVFLDDHGSDRRIWPNPAKPPPGQPFGGRHEPVVGFCN